MIAPADTVSIVGGGLAGCSTAIHLATLRPDLIRHLEILEKSRFPRDKPCGGGLTGLAIGLLQSFDSEILKHGAVRIAYVLLAAGKKIRPLRLNQPMAVVHRRALDHRIAKVAMERGISLREGVAVRAAKVGVNGATIDVEGGDRSIKARALIGADGARSVIRPAVSNRRRGLARLIEVVTPDRLDQAPHLRSTIVFDFSAIAAGLQGYTWRFPCEIDGRPHINWGIFDSGIHEDAPRAHLPVILKEFMASNDYPTSREDWISHPVRRFHPDDDFSAPNIILIGDAAGVDPALGEGISLALDYGDLAANALIDAFDRSDFSFRDFKERLFGHPVGQSLILRHQMARQLYDPVSGGGEAAIEIMSHWLSSEA